MCMYLGISFTCSPFNFLIHVVNWGRIPPKQSWVVAGAELQLGIVLRH